MISKMLKYVVHFRTVDHGKEDEFLVEVNMKVEEFLHNKSISHEDLIYNKALHIINSSNVYISGNILLPIDIISLEFSDPILH
jgi:hypothetical protein